MSLFDHCVKRVFVNGQVLLQVLQECLLPLQLGLENVPLQFERLGMLLAVFILIERGKQLNLLSLEVLENCMITFCLLVLLNLLLQLISFILQSSPEAAC